jgi:outer membrane beta-barrel protein
MTTLFKNLLPFALLCAAPAAWAQDEEGGGDDELGDILGEPKEGTVAEEKKSVDEAAKEETTALPDEGPREKRVIKTLQRKTFLKLGRYEAAPHIGFVTNDPFINRYLVGASFAYHVTEIFAIEGVGSFSPDFGQGDWKPITDQLVNENRVSPDISKIMYYGNVNFQFSPIYGKIAVSGKRIINFDIFGSFGTGTVNTRDDLKALQAEDDPTAIATEKQFHATTNFGGGFRVIFSESLAARLEGRSMVYIETIDSTTLEMKNNFMLLASASIFFPSMD